ncbi:MAG: capsule assembly Wzi family protein [Ignavibacteria bacterium]|nr:capsule assembly Wzi family protein [Ignavibacteria bacterium]
MIKLSFHKIVFLTLVISGLMGAQIIYSPLKSNVYDFLDRVSQKINIHYYDIVKPIPRKEIANLLKEIERSSKFLSDVEKEELKWYENDYSYEMDGIIKRWRLFEYADTLFRVVLTPEIQLQQNSFAGKKNLKTRWLGGFYGSIGENIGYSFSLTDNSEGGDSIDADKIFSPFTGFNHKTSKDGTISFEDINAMLTYNWSWGSFSLGKDYINWGSGRNGHLILSSKAPSFPFIKFDMSPVKWLRFHYIHAWLASDVPDSSAFYVTTVTDKKGNPVYREEQRSKYLAANFLSIIPDERFIFSLGNSIIYSDGSVKIPFLIPFIWYYKGIDHNFYGSTKNDGYGNNGQMFFNFSMRYPENSHFYSTLFIDEFSLTGILKGDHSRDQLGYTIGGTNYSSVIDNLLLEFEYTKIMPGTYLNYVQTQTYQNASYDLGHWIGQNADQLYLGASYQFFRALNAKIYYEQVRKGGAQRGTDFKYTKDIPFLYLPLQKWHYLGATINYQPLYDLNVHTYFRFVNYSSDSGITEVYKKNSVDVGVGLSYGVY